MRSPSLVLTFGMLTGLLGAGYGVLFTMLDEYRDQHGITESRLGVIIAVGFLAGFLAQLFIAPLADRGHARRLVIVGVLLNVAGLLTMAFATAFAPLVLGRLITGLGIGTAVPAVRRIVILAEPENIGENLGRLLALDVGGFALGPALAAVLVGPFGIPAPFLVIAVATLIAVALVWRVRVAETEVDEATQRLAVDLLRIRPFLGAVVLGSVVYLMIGTFDALWAVTLDDLDASEWLANLGISLFAVPLVVLGPFGGRLSQGLGPFRTATAGLLVGSLAMALYGQMPTATAMFVLAIAHSLSDGLTVSSAGIAAGMSVPSTRQAGAQGVLGAAQTLTAGITAVIAGVLYEQHGRTVAYTTSAMAMLVLTLTGAWLARNAFGRSGRRSAPPPSIGPQAATEVEEMRP